MKPTISLRDRPALAAAAVTLVMLAAAVVVLRWEGRLWSCGCGQWRPWTGAWERHTSQHLFDPYAFTHLLHGMLFWWALAWTKGALSPTWRGMAALGVETLWELLENSQWVIDRYRTHTAALGYEGDTVVNVLGDIAACGLGILLVQRLSWRWSVAVFVVTEAVLLVTIRDSLLLNVVMLLMPLEALKQWQLAATA